MPELCFIRHAKSSWRDPALSDQQRPLKGRGRRDCALMAPAIQALGLTFDAVFCSSAQRAQQTLEHVLSNGLDLGVERSVEADLYTFSAQVLITWCQQLNPALQRVLVVGHNPAMLDTVNRCCGVALENLPTCAFARMQFSGSWQELGSGCANLKSFITPRQLKSI